MKKFVGILMMTAMIMGLTACGSAAKDADTTDKAESAVTTEVTVASEEENNVETSDVSETENHSEDTNTEASNTLVVYFSATGTTKGVAETIAQTVGGDLYEIVPVNPYSDADLNYNDTSSRSTAEQNDKSTRPEIDGSIDNWDEYDVVFVGYPIWWSEEPRIMDTFVESYDFSGKTVVPFCTSGGSGIGRSGSNLESLAGSGNWLAGERWNGSVSESDISSWVSGLGL